DCDGCDHSALRRRGTLLLRAAARTTSALYREPQHSHPVRGVLDRNRLAGDRTVCGTLALGVRAETAEAGCGRAVLRAPGDRSGLDGLRLARLAIACRVSLRFLAGCAGPGIYQHGPRLADPAVRRAAVLVVAVGTRALARPEEAFGDAWPGGDGLSLGHLHRS